MGGFFLVLEFSRKRSVTNGATPSSLVEDHKFSPGTTFVAKFRQNRRLGPDPDHGQARAVWE